MTQQCPCCSGNLYDFCCKPFHAGAAAPTPQALMRSRYSAYVLGNASYIIRTTHPKSIYFEKDQKKWEKAILSFSHSTQFLHLDILEHKDDWVLFRACLTQESRTFYLKEKSHFQMMGDHWLYLSGEITIENS